MNIKVATLQYRYDFPSSFEAYQEKISRIVSSHASQGVQLLLFPEYAACEMLSFASLEKLQEDLSLYLEFFQALSQQYQMLICAGTHMVKTHAGTFNRSYLFSPNQDVLYQDKCLLTPYEVGEGILSPSNSLKVFETKLGKIAICICYDVEFPSLVQKLIEQDVRLILVPSYTSSVQGFYRVFLSCRARALESQCYVVQSALVGQTDVEMAFGSSAICGPVDENFPEDGVIALGNRDVVESVCATLDLSLLDNVRAKGQTRNYSDRKVLDQRSISVESFDLR